MLAAGLHSSQSEVHFEEEEQNPEGKDELDAPRESVPSAGSAKGSPMMATTPSTKRPPLNDLVIALRARAGAIRNGHLASVLFMRTTVPKKQQRQSKLHSTYASNDKIEISGHIDLAHRFKTENFLPYLTGEKRLIPRKGDLTYYNW